MARGEFSAADRSNSNPRNYRACSAGTPQSDSCCDPRGRCGRHCDGRDFWRLAFLPSHRSSPALAHGLADGRAGAMAFGICAVEVVAGRPKRAHRVGGLLLLCWSFETAARVAAPAAILALLLRFRAAHFAPLFTARRVATVWIFTIGVARFGSFVCYAYLWHFAWPRRRDMAILNSS